MNDYIEKKIAEYEEHVYGKGQMPTYNKQALRRVLEDYERYIANEERETSRSPVGDEFNMGTNEE